MMHTEVVEHIADRAQAGREQSLLRLLQLASPALPVGGFSYSQGLEAAVQAGCLQHAKDAEQWLLQVLERVILRCDALIWSLAYAAWQAHDERCLCEVNQWFIASRETRAWRDETRQMGWSLARLAAHLGWLDGAGERSLLALATPAYPVMFAGCAQALGLEAGSALSAFLFAWLEGQTIALQKLLPIGQQAGQAMLFRLAACLPEGVAKVQERARGGLAAVESAAPHLSILAARHESQYSRLFRT